jgi:hypothetical protein
MHNFRRYLREYTVEALTTYGFDRTMTYPSLGNKSLVDIINILWGDSNVGAAVYETRFYGLSRKIILDMLGSGELGTIDLNNVANEALARYLRRLMTELHTLSGLSLVHRSIMGDDREEIYQLKPEMITDITAMLDDLHAAYIKSFEDNDFQINGPKTCIRFHRSEYLKITCAFGRFVSRRHTQYFISEKNSKFVDIVEYFRSLRSVFNLLIFRGSNMDFLRKLFYILCSISLNERFDDSEHGRIRLIYYNPAIIFTPVSLGGLGLPVYNIVGSSSDAVVAYQLFQPEHSDLLEAVNRVAAISQYPSLSLAKDLANEVLTNGAIVDDVRMIPPGVDWIMENVVMKFTNRMTSAVSAQRVLTESGFSPPKNLFFIEMPTQLVERALRGAEFATKAQFDLRQYVQGIRMIECLTKSTTNILVREFPWVQYINFSLHEANVNDYQLYGYPAELKAPSEWNLVTNEMVVGKTNFRYYHLDEIAFESRYMIFILPETSTDFSYSRRTMYTRICDDLRIETKPLTVVASQNKLHPFPCMQDHAQIPYNFLGMRLAGKQNLMVGVEVMSYLRSTDPWFPRHYTTEAILDFIMQPDIIDSREMLQYTLMYMGYDNSLAPIAADFLYVNKESILISGKNSGYSWGDPYFSSLPFGISSEMFTNEFITGRRSLDSIISAIACQYCVYSMLRFRRPFSVSANFMLDDRGNSTLLSLMNTFGLTNHLHKPSSFGRNDNENYYVVEF